MTDTSTSRFAAIQRNAHHRSETAAARTKRRYAAEAVFKYFGLLGVVLALGMLAFLLLTIGLSSVTAFTQTYLDIEVYLDPEEIDPENTGDPRVIRRGDFQGLANDFLYAQFPDVSGRTDRRELRGLLGPAPDFMLREMVLEDPSLIGQTITITVEMADDFDQLAKGRIDRNLPSNQRRVSDQQIAWYDDLKEQGLIEVGFNRTLFTGANSRQPELAGIWAAIIGSAMTMGVTLALAFPIGVAAAVYLEEFAPKNRWTDLVEVNINNLAAVPSIVFGLLGLAVFIQFFGLPQSAPLVGGMVIALMSLPTIIIAARAALKAVPPSIREAAYGVGASKLQVVTHHVLPLAMPGILTGTIIAMAQALGETAPLLMIGMVIFITTVPDSLTDAATVLPVQIYSWAGNPERGFTALTSAAIMILLGFLITMNAIAVYLRKKFERRW